MGSDHLPITLTLNKTICKVRSANRTYINFAKAKWNEFLEYTEEAFSKISARSSVHLGEKVFTTILNKGRKIFIPSGRIPKTIPNFPSSAAKLADERDQIQRNNTRISVLNKEINKEVNKHKKEKWLDVLTKASFSQGPKNLWKITKSLMKDQRSHNNNSYHL